jgi:ribosomal-protein-alanine N-acetyltransferase
MVGYNIDGNYQKQGFASEALTALAEWAFRHPAMRRMLAETPQDNFASQSVLTKNGFVKTAAAPAPSCGRKQLTIDN